MAKQHTPETVRRARELYFRGVNITEISNVLGVTKATISRWRDKDKWPNQKGMTEISPESITRKLKQAMLAILDEAELNNRVLTIQDSDQLSKLTAAMKKIDPGSNYISVAMDIMKRYQSFLMDRGVMSDELLTVTQEFLSQEMDTYEFARQIGG